jgi:hypothetical protein
LRSRKPATTARTDYWRINPKWLSRSSPGRAAGEDLVSLVEGHGFDLVIVDADLAGCLAVAEALPQRSVVLLQHMYATFVDSWLTDIWPVLSGPVNRRRRDHGLEAATGWRDVFAGHN